MSDKDDPSPYFPEYFENYLKPKFEEKLSDKKDEGFIGNRPWYDSLRGTSLEGFGHVFSEESNCAVKLFWVVVVIACFITSVVLLQLSFKWNSETPTVTVIDSLFNPVWNHYFPAVTICNTNRISLSAATNLASKL